MDKKKRVLFLTTVFPYPLDNGGKIRAYNNIKALSREYELDLICFAEDEIKEAYIDNLKEYCSHIKIIPKIFSNSLSKKVAIKNIFISLIKNTPFIVEKFYDNRCKKYINELLGKYEYQAVFFEHLSITCYKKLFDGTVNIILSQQNCEYRLMERRYNEANNFVKKVYIFWEYLKLKKYELKMCKQFDEVIMLSEEDKEGLTEEGYDKENINIIPIGVKVDGYQKTLNNNGKCNNILFMGTMTWYPNEQGILWFIDNVWGRLKVINPKLSLYVVGKSPCEQLLKKNNVNDIIVTGYVDDINEYIEKCDICIVPLFIGGGMRVKILESMAKKIPCISTNIGAEGIDIQDKVSIMLANTADEFIYAIKEINENEGMSEEIVYNAYELVSEKYSEEAVGKMILDLLEDK